MFALSTLPSRMGRESEEGKEKKKKSKNMRVEIRILTKTEKRIIIMTNIYINVYSK